MLEERKKKMEKIPQKRVLSKRVAARFPGHGLKLLVPLDFSDSSRTKNNHIADWLATS